MQRTALAPLLALAAMCALLGACSKTPEPSAGAPPAPPPPKAASSAPAHAAAHAGSHADADDMPAAPSGPNDLAWDAPAAWQTAPNPNTMRKATYKIPKAAGDAEDAELSVTQAGGTVQANVDRWSGQFEKGSGAEPKREDRKVGDLKVTVVELHGTFNGAGMPGTATGEAKPRWAMLGAIVEASPMPWFFKMTGPDKTVSAARADFDKMVGSLRAK